MMHSSNGVLRAMLFLLLTMLSGLLHATSANIVVIDPLAEQIDLSGNMSLLSDPQRRLAFSEVTTLEDKFIPVTRLGLVKSFNAGAFWLRVSLRNETGQTLRRWLAVGTAKTQRVTFHLHQDDGWQILQSGRSVALLDKPIVALEPVFPITLLPGKQLDLLLRIDSPGASNMATTLWEPYAYHRTSSKFQIREAALIGGLLISGVLSLLVFIRLRQAQYFWLGLMLIALAGLEGSRENFLGTYFWPAHLALPAQSLAIFAVIVLFCLSMVVAHALELAERLPVANRLMLALRWITVAGALLAIFNYGLGLRIMSLTSVVQHIATLVLSVLAWRRGQPNALIFLLAFSLALITEISRQLANLGLLPWIDAMGFSVFFFLLASPLMLLGLIEQTRQLTERLQVSEQLQQAKSAFLARISHELRSPLNTILGYSRMLARGSAKLSPSEGTTGIEKSALRLLALIDELLDEARAAAGQLTINPSLLPMRPWLDDIARTVEMTIKAKGNRFFYTFSGDASVSIIADGKRLRQVLENLLNNANRHTLDGHITLACTTIIKGPRARVDFAVEDTGEGIPPASLSSIFEPFVRCTTPSKGHGLGLSICRELVQQMGGEISASSVLGQGSRFCFSLSFPIKTTTTTEYLPQPIGAPDSASMPSATINRPSVLLVDDDGDYLTMLSEQMVEAGFEIIPIAGGHAALARILHDDWDLLITDQMMPEIDGWSVLRAARQEKTDLPVILLSAVEPLRPANFPAAISFDASLLKSDPFENILAIVWRLILKISPASAPLNWQKLAQLANDGDVSAIEDWVTTHRATATEYDYALRWVENALHRLDLAILEHAASAIARDSLKMTGSFTDHPRG